MPAKVTPREVTPIIARFRTWLLGGRGGPNYLRFEGMIAARTQPQPNLPDGPHAKLSANYYYDRDARRILNPPLLIASDQKLIASSSAELPRKYRTPGKVYAWDAPL